MNRFFISQDCNKGDIVVITGREAHHIRDVRRLKKGTRLQLFDGQGSLYQGKILDTQAKQVKVQIDYACKDVPKSNLEITLVQALPRKNKMDYIVEKSTELGVDVIIPTQTSRTIVKLDKSGQSVRRLRWQRIAVEAAKQCGRSRIPQVKSLTSWKYVLPSLNNSDLKLLACLDANTQKMKDVLHAQKRVRKVTILIGPEGDFSPEEVEQATSSGCVTVSLGTNVLKSDTACVSALTMINYELT